MSESRFVNIIVSYILIVIGSLVGHLVGKRVASPVRETVGMSPTPGNPDAADALQSDNLLDPTMVVRTLIPGVAAATALRTFGLRNPIANGVAAFAVSFGMTVFGDTRVAQESRSVLKRVSPLGPLVG